MDWLGAFVDQASLTGLFVYSFFAATLLPGGSELLLGALIAGSPELYWSALLLASLGNTLGGLVSLGCGRILPQPPALAERRGGRWIYQHGAPALLLSWLPLVGDMLCIAAGWLRVSVWQAAVYIAVGKFARYWLVAEGVRRTLN